MGNDEFSSPFEVAILEKLDTLAWTPLDMVTPIIEGAGPVLEDKSHMPVIEEKLKGAHLIEPEDRLVLPYGKDNEMWEALTIGPQTAAAVILRVNERGRIEAAVLKGTEDVNPTLRDGKSGTTLDRDEVLTMMNSNTFDHMAIFVVEGPHFEIKNVEASPALLGQ